MDADLTTLRDSVASFVTHELRPLIKEYENKQRFPLGAFKTMGDLGCFGAIFPEGAGGSGLGKTAQCLVIEELAKASGGITTTCLVQVLSLLPIFLHGSPQIKERYLRAGIKGHKIGCIAVTEPDHGSDVAGMETTAVRENDGFRLNGTKAFITNAPLADFFVVAAKTDARERHRGITLFVIDRDTPGLQVGPHIKKLGWFTSETSPLYLEHCRVLDANVLGEVGHGFYYIMGRERRSETQCCEHC
jgi:acyl-CoA dehydrogenase